MGTRGDCCDPREVCLFPLITEGLACIRLHHLTAIRMGNIRKQQTGFHPVRGNVDQIFTFR